MKFFGKKCSCDKKEPIIYTETIPTMAGDVNVGWCEECYEKKLAFDAAEKAESERKAAIERAERRKQNYYEKLKREVEIRQLEDAAEDLGIDCAELK